MNAHSGSTTAELTEREEGGGCMGIACKGRNL